MALRHSILPSSDLGLTTITTRLTKAADVGTFGPVILHIGRDLHLLQIRSQVLQFACAHVERCHDLIGIDSLLARYTEGLLVLCHSLSEAERQEALTKVKQRRPHFRSLVIARSSFGYQPGQESVCTAEGPRALIKKARELLTKQSQVAA